MEVTESRGARPQPDVETSSSIVQMYRMHSYIWNVQTV